eukprot:gene30522-31067_t
MGNGICHVFAQSGFTVSMMDIKQEALDKAIATIGKNMDRQVAKGSLTEEAKQAALSRITTHADLAAAVKNAQLVVEAATENVELKLNIFRQLDAAPIVADQQIMAGGESLQALAEALHEILRRAA